jgi:predicted phosphodiesterase
MKILVFSDTHLSKFDSKKYRLLKQIIHDSDRVIINGDFIDDWLISGKEFLESRWKSLFPLLLTKQTIYIRGNHEETITHEVASHFSIKFCDSHEEYIKEKKFLFEHGDNIIKKNQFLFPKVNNKIIIHFRFLLRFFYFLENSFNTLMPQLSKRFFKGKKQNNILKNYYTDKEFFLITGDTHNAELDLEKNFANTGEIMNGYASYILITNGDIKLVSTKY